ncbi:hypothetical protein [Myxococcus sp. RHSTA-1-4]|uniref:hypothetical protein n=1 Tax=Myxococcus sp. RHSTA-1-4 TaxID=2874601 RepID=UPI001CBDF3FF|nr:hypothetical protein [Myxococcus sp. RHSTA-1-4]MBZ4417512.1 hypothetical protein [Myxococcus sp. RHSTA-1-4]
MCRRHVWLELAALLVAVSSGCASGPIRIGVGVVDDADYTLTQVSILPPPPQPGAGVVTVRIAYELHQPGGNVAPAVQVFDDDGALNADDVVDRGQLVVDARNLSPGPHEGTLTFTLTCDADNKVVGRLDGTGEGHNPAIGPRNPADIKARVGRPGNASHPTLVSNEVELWCES